jgi:hypothetical protein
VYAVVWRFSAQLSPWTPPVFGRSFGGEDVLALLHFSRGSVIGVSPEKCGLVFGHAPESGPVLRAHAYLQLPSLAGSEMFSNRSGRPSPSRSIIIASTLGHLES